MKARMRIRIQSSDFAIYATHWDTNPSARSIAALSRSTAFA